MTIFNKIKLFFIFYLFAYIVNGEDLYVRPSGGTGSGTSWTAAWNGFNAIQWGNGVGLVGPGDTLWIAGGNYNGPFTVGNSGTAGARIYIKRALASESACTSADGWVAGYDSTVFITALPTDTPVGFGCSGNNGSYVTIDGGVIHAGFDILLTSQTTGMNQTGMGGLQLSYANNITDLTFKNAYIHGSPTQPWCWGEEQVGGPCAAGQVTACRGMNISPNDSRYQANNITISGVYLRYCNDAIFMGRNNNTIIEHCIIRDITSNGGNNHPNNVYASIESNGPFQTTFRYNLVDNAQNTGFFFASTGSWVTDTTRSGWYFYGNVFNNLPETWAYAIQMKTKGHILYNDVYIVNNTFVNVSGPYRWDNETNDPVPEGISANNIFCNSSVPGFYFGGPNEGHHYTNSDTGIFQNAAGLNFQLSAPLVGGVAFTNSGQMTLDPLDNVRGSDGDWDIGAYEYGGTPAAPNITSNNIIGGIGTNFFQSMTASGAPTNWFADGLPSALSINSAGSISGIVVDPVTNLSVTLRAYNVTGGDTQAVLVTFYPLVSSLFVSSSTLSFPVTKTGTLSQLSFILSNHTGTIGTTATGIVHQITDPKFIIIGDTNWNLTGTATKTITVGYSNNLVTTNLGYLTLTTSGTPLTNTLYGSAAPIASGTNFQLYSALIIPPMTTNANNKIYNTNENNADTPNGYAWFFINAPVPGYFNFAITTYGATNGSTDSIYWYFNNSWKVIDLVAWTEELQPFITRTNNFGDWVTNYNYTNTTSGDILVGVGGRETPAYSTNISWKFFSTGGSDSTPPTVTIQYPTNGTYITVNNSQFTGFAGTASDDSALYSVVITNVGKGVSYIPTGTATWTNSTISLFNGLNTLTVIATDTNSNTASDTLDVFYNVSSRSIGKRRFVPH